MTQKEACSGRALPVVSVLATGGTIAGLGETPGSISNYQPGVVEAHVLFEAIPQLERIATVRCFQIANVGSEDMTPAVWFDLCRALHAQLARPEVTGVVVLHGTDTMEETACFLDLTIQPSTRDKPVVLTGAMRTADAVSADGPANILAAVTVAAHPDSSSRGVLMVMNDTIHQARRVYKADTLNLDAFRSMGGVEGVIVDGHPFYHHPPWTGIDPPAFSLDGVDELPDVEIIYGHAGQGRRLVDAALAGGAWGIVHAGVGLGNVHCAARPALAEAAAAGIVVVCASRVGGGRTVQTERNRRDRFVSAGMLNPQKARVLLQLALTQTTDYREVRDIFARYQ